MTGVDDTNEPRLESWVPVAAQSDFPIQNLPCGVFSSAGRVARIGVAIGDRIVDLRAVAEAGLLDGVCDRALLSTPTLNGFFAAGRDVQSAVRRRLSSLLRADGDASLREANADAILVESRAATMHLPVEIGDYVDFYSSIEHATNLGKMFRPDAEPLLPNWRWLPVGYHGRSATVVVDGTPVVRPHGQRKPSSEPGPVFAPTAMLDIELEVGFFTGRPNAAGFPIAASDAPVHIAGVVLVNDWSARDIQAWEYQPLGPFLGKSFATTISPWVVSLDALEPFRVSGPRQEPPPLPYLKVDTPSAYAIQLSVQLETAAMRENHVPPQVISRTTFAGMYWSMAQQLAHATVNGALTRPGDLFASGTISGSQPASQGSLIELTWRGERPIALGNGEMRTFLEDGDMVTLRGWCERDGARRIGFGAARGAIASAI